MGVYITLKIDLIAISMLVLSGRVLGQPKRNLEPLQPFRSVVVGRHRLLYSRDTKTFSRSDTYAAIDADHQKRASK